MRNIQKHIIDGNGAITKSSQEVKQVSAIVGKGGEIDNTKIGRGSELEKFYAESESLSSELQTVTTAFPSAVLDKALSPRDISSVLIDDSKF